LPLVPYRSTGARSDLEHGAPGVTDGRLTPELVVGALGPFLSDERKRRIEHVLRGRLASVTVVLENLYDPHNGAAVLRTCEALGLHHVHVVEGSEPFFFSRKVSQSAHKWLTVYLHPTVDACLGALHGAGFRCWAAVPPPLRSIAPATAPSGAHEAPVRPFLHHTLHPPGLTLPAGCPTALVFGNEHAGLSARAVELCDGRFGIPMHGFCESLNLSVSVAVALRPLVDGRRAHLGRTGDLGAEALRRLRAGYYALSTPRAVELVLRQLGPEA
jgi:tRNA (guanosine-2'-O-)-methyltransferase